MAAQFATIGHSDRDIDEFPCMLHAARIGMVIDVRRFPRSRSYPAYNADRLPDDLARVQIGYRHWPAFGGRRSRQRGVEEHTNALWRVKNFHNYADYAMSDKFAAALGELESLGQSQRVALMCAEAVWWRCHRRIIADYLLLHGHPVDHLMGPGRVVPAKPTPEALTTAQGQVIYPVRGQADESPGKN